VSAESKVNQKDGFGKMTVDFVGANQNIPGLYISMDESAFMHAVKTIHLYSVNLTYHLNPNSRNIIYS
jgi:hypothetical protein